MTVQQKHMAEVIKALCNVDSMTMISKTSSTHQKQQQQRQLRSYVLFMLSWALQTLEVATAL
jgi:hypothetical protein